MADWKAWMVSGALVSLGGCCVARGTRVRTPMGWRCVEELRLGDAVLSFDPVTGETVTGPVTMIRSVERETMLLAVGATELRLTTDHPVYCPDEGVYAAAGDWALGLRERLWRLETDGQSAPCVVTSSVVDGGVREVFDITVDTPLHNFLAEGFLVHNKSPVALQCTFEGATTSEYTSCECEEGGTGYVVCDPYEGTGSCMACPVDAGIDAATPGDAGTDAAAPEDGSVSDAAIPDAGTASGDAATDASVVDASMDDAG